MRRRYGAGRGEEGIQSGDVTVLLTAKVAKTHENLRRAGVAWRDDDE